MKIALIIETKHAVAIEMMLPAFAGLLDQHASELEDKALPRTAALARRQADEVRELISVMAEAIKVARHAD